MTQQEYQQGRDTLIDTLNWSEDSILDFAGEVLRKTILETSCTELVDAIAKVRVDFNATIDEIINEVEGVK